MIYSFPCACWRKLIVLSAAFSAAVVFVFFRKTDVLWLILYSGTPFYSCNIPYKSGTILSCYKWCIVLTSLKLCKHNKMSTRFLCTFQSCCFIFQIAAQSACFRHNKIITKEYVPYEYTGIRKLSGKNLPWKPFISIYHLTELDPTGFFVCADPLACWNGAYLYK